MRSIRVRRRARADLAEIWAYTAEHWGIEQADAYIADIETTMAELCRNPNLGSDRSDLHPGLRKARAGSHFIYYLAEEPVLDVVRILHERRDTSAIA